MRTDRTRSAYSGFLRALRDKSLNHLLPVKAVPEETAAPETGPDPPEAAPNVPAELAYEEEAGHA